MIADLLEPLKRVLDAGDAMAKSLAEYLEALNVGKSGSELETLVLQCARKKRLHDAAKAALEEKVRGA